MIVVQTFTSPLGLISVAECKGRALAVNYGAYAALFDRFPALKASCAQVQALGQLSPGAPVTSALNTFLNGESMQLKVVADLSYIEGEFDRTILKTLFRRKSQSRISYGQLATLAGHPGAARAVGSVMARNPLPIIIPCHRVVRSDGSIGEYTGGREKKEWLLARETIQSVRG